MNLAEIEDNIRILLSDVDEKAFIYGLLNAYGKPKAFVLCSWGAYDLTQLKADCKRSSLPFPGILEHHINLKKEFANLRGTRPLGMAQALSLAQIPLIGIHHRAIDDARNIAQLAISILPPGRKRTQSIEKALGSSGQVA